MNRLVFSLLLCVSGMVHADAFAAKRARVLALGKLTTAPAMMDAEGFRSDDGIRAIYFDALAYEGKPTKVFAWLGLPKERAGKVPGIVLVHGGGGTAFRKWVEKWNEKGFAAIAIAHEGQVERREAKRKWAKHPWPGPWRSGHYKDSAMPLEDQWMYHAVADTILANSLLRSQPEVDEEKVGVMGVSWGGVITSTVMGIDPRFAFAIPTYGCGQMADVDNHWGASLGGNTFYRQVWDPIHYLPRARMPALWFSWPEDHHFPLDSQAASYRAMPGDTMVALLPGMRHSTRASYDPPDSYAFAESVIRDGKPWCRQISSQANGTSLEVVFSSSKALDRAVLISTTDTGFTGKRKWIESPAKLKRSDGPWVVTATLSKETTACFVNVKAGDLTASSEYVELNESAFAKADKPNVVIVITDDQGYGDVAFTGNPAIKTPTLDRLRTQGILLNNFHVDPTCAPTRSALMTGRYSDRVGVWHTVQGRSMLRRREITMADVFSKNGYATGMFGKWHLGDCYPYRPEDRGFQHCVYHKAGGVGQAPDYWGNDYFDDTYIVNGKHQRFEGFCTDIWFDEGMKFIKSNKDKPFFAYISTNAPHSPYYCPEKYTTPYEGNPQVSITEFYGMITNIDDNMAKLMKLLEDEGIADNTILVFMTDNGTAGGLKNGRGYDGGMRGRKNSEYDGGHRVPFMIRWPDGKLEAGKSVERLTAHMDILPTFIELCGLKAPAIEFDGTDIRDLLYTDGKDWPDRALVVESQRVVDPIKWRKSAVMTDRWRLVNGKELYDLKADPKQVTDLATKHPEVLNRLRGEYDAFWNDVSREHDLTSYMVIGSDRSPVVSLSSHDWLIDKLPPWNQSHIVRGAVAEESFWAIEVERPGVYEISLRRWPVEADKSINDGTYGKAFNYKQARMRIGDIDETKNIPEGAREVTFRVSLKKGITRLAPTFIGPDRTATPYYAYVTHKPKPGWQTPQGMGIPVYDPSYGRVPPQKRK